MNGLPLHHLQVLERFGELGRLSGTGAGGLLNGGHIRAHLHLLLMMRLQVGDLLHSGLVFSFGNDV